MIRDKSEREMHHPQASRRITPPKCLVHVNLLISNVDHSRDPVSGLPRLVIEEYLVDTICFRAKHPGLRVPVGLIDEPRIIPSRLNGALCGDGTKVHRTQPLVDGKLCRHDLSRDEGERRVQRVE
jgi:hypothetical protein